MGIKEFLKSYNSPVDECKLLSVLDQYRSTMDVNISRIAFAEMDK